MNGTCVWKEIPASGSVFSSALVTEYHIECNGERCAGMLNGRQFSYCPFCGEEIESQANTEANQK
jgi:hypothetical protein